MKILYCDVCRKPVQNPMTGLSYFHIADIDICEACNDELRSIAKSQLRGKQPFDYGWYDEFTLRILRDGMQKGKLQAPKR
ncbi:MAG: hypothetical protein Q8M76_11535 [Spirochaetaceae bacterium]|nr:hypothetical protein [Spirochaetaceae bacterium]